VAWVVTVPSAAAIGAGMYLITAELPPVAAGVCLAVGFLVVGWLTLRSMRSAPSASDFEHPAEPQIIDLAETMGVAEVIDDVEPEESAAG
jgi:hypothetical protein